MSPRTIRTTRRRAFAVAGILSLAAPLVLVCSLHLWARSAAEHSRHDGARTSYAVGLSTGASFRDVMPISIDDFRRGLLDGLGGEDTQTRIMPRPELFAEIRRVMKRLSDAEVAAVAARVDAEQDY